MVAGPAGGSLAFGFGIATIAEPGAVSSQTPSHHHVRHVRAVQVTDPRATIMRAFAVEFAPELSAKHQLLHRLSGFGAARLVPLGRGQAIQPNRHTPQLDGVAISNVGDLAGQGAARTLCGGGQRDRQQCRRQSGAPLPLVDVRGEISMPRVVMILIILFVVSPLTERRAGQERSLDGLPVLTADTPKQCCHLCKKGKACGNGCISQERQCTKEPGCACGASGSS
jgi:hypothetical protein